MASNPEEDPTDADLVARCQNGDMSAYNELVRRHQGKVYAMIRNMVKNETDAWDLAQDSFIKAWKALPKFEAKAKFSTWLFRIAHNVVYDWLRKHRLERGSDELNDELLGGGRVDFQAPTSPRPQTSPDEEMERTELRQQIEAGLAKLSIEHREIILLREVQGMAYKEIAEILECSQGTVMSRLFHARKNLKQHLES